MPTATNKPFGIRGGLTPASAFQDIKEDILYDGGIVVSIYDKIFEIGYDKEEDKERAEKIAQDYLAFWSFGNGIKAEALLNMSWKPNPNGNRDIGIEAHEDIKVHDRVITSVSIKGMAYIVKPHSDSYSFMNYTDLVKKAERDQTLSWALKYFYDEVLNTKRPKVGIYRIVEELEKKVGGLENLARLANQDKKYVGEIMESVQEHRHSWAWLGLRGAKVKLSEQECVERAKRLIQAYADSLV